MNQRKKGAQVELATRYGPGVKEESLAATTRNSQEVRGEQKRNLLEKSIIRKVGREEEADPTT